MPVSLSVHRLSWVTFIVVFLGSSWHIPGSYLCYVTATRHLVVCHASWRALGRDCRWHQVWFFRTGRAMDWRVGALRRCYLIVSGSILSWVKTARSWCRPSTCTWWLIKECIGLYIYSPIPTALALHCDSTQPIFLFPFTRKLHLLPECAVFQSIPAMSVCPSASRQTISLRVRIQFLFAVTFSNQKSFYYRNNTLEIPFPVPTSGAPTLLQIWIMNTECVASSVAQRPPAHTGTARLVANWKILTYQPVQNSLG